MSIHEERWAEIYPGDDFFGRQDVQDILDKQFPKQVAIDFNVIKCNKCQYFKRCKRKSVMKGTDGCEIAATRRSAELNMSIDKGEVVYKIKGERVRVFLHGNIIGEVRA